MYEIIISETIKTTTNKQINENYVYDLIVNNINGSNELLEVIINMELYNFYYDVAKIHEVYVDYELNDVNYKVIVYIDVYEERSLSSYGSYVFILIILIYIIIKYIKSKKNID